MRVGNSKFCPRCGRPVGSGDSYCIKCGYRFGGGIRKSNPRTIIVVLIVIAALWIGMRLYLKQPIIPEGLVETVKNLFAKKAG